MKITPLKIGNLAIDPPVILAPMAGYTRMPFRSICRRLGCNLVFTEMVTAEGIVRGMPRTMSYLKSISEERPIGAHIYGANPDSLAEAARIIESLGKFDLIDINCGCPVRKVVNRGAGVALMREPEKIRSIVEAISGAVSLPVTVKTRLGTNPGLFNISEVAQAIEEGGASAIFLHARLASAHHSGPADWETLGRIKSERSIPVVGNGGITNAFEATEILAQTGVDGVMIGKASIGNPWIFDEIRCHWTGQPYTPPSNQERSEVIAEHIKGLAELTLAENQLRKRPIPNTEQSTCRDFQGHLSRYLRGVSASKNLLRNITAMTSIEDAISAIDEVMGSPSATSDG